MLFQELEKCQLLLSDKYHWSTAEIHRPTSIASLKSHLLALILDFLE